MEEFNSKRTVFCIFRESLSSFELGIMAEVELLSTPAFFQSVKKTWMSSALSSHAGSYEDPAGSSPIKIHCF